MDINNSIINTFASIGGSMLKPRNDLELTTRRKWMFWIIIGIVILSISWYGIQILLQIDIEDDSTEFVNSIKSKVN